MKILRTFLYLWATASFFWQGDPVCWEEWAKAVKVVDEIWSKRDELCLSQKTKPVVKYTIPGPMTLLEGLDDQHYGPENRRQLIEDTIHCIRQVK